MSRSSIFHTIGLRIRDERALNYELWSDFCTSYKDLKRSKIRGLPLNEGVNWELPETTTGVILLSTTVISRQKFISTIGNTSGKWTFAREIASSERWYKSEFCWVVVISRSASVNQTTSQRVRRYSELFHSRSAKFEFPNFELYSTPLNQWKWLHSVTSKSGSKRVHLIVNPAW